jgi:mono/diheme cytochrome c family protein
MMRSSRFAAVAALTLSVTVASAISASAAELPFDRVANGRYQAVLGDCAGCHTPPGGAPFAGGVALPTPFGTLVGANITPDAETGIGAWSESDFRNALKKGIGHDGVRLYPAMPYPAYAKMSDRDVSDLWAYLRSLQPVKNEIKSNQLPFPFNIRAVMIGWNWLNFTPGDFKPDPNKSAQWNRGAYIVQGAGHCATCHSPKTALGADKASAFLGGAVLQDWLAPKITNAPREGLGEWNVDDVTAYLKTGANRFDIASGPMAEVVTNSTAKMTDADLRAIAVYLKDLPGEAPKATPVAAGDPGMKAGAAVYADNCSACHGLKGEGQPRLFPQLAGNALTLQADATSLIRVVLAGSQGVGTQAAPTTPAMPSLAWRLNDAQVADVLTYVRNTWGNAAPPVAPGAVGKLRKALKSGS